MGAGAVVTWEAVIAYDADVALLAYELLNDVEAYDAEVARVAVVAFPCKLPVNFTPEIGVNPADPVPKALYNCSISVAYIVLPFTTFDGFKVAIFYLLIKNMFIK